MADQTKKPDLWTPRSVDDTQKIYADWADTYEADVGALNYATPDRIANALVSVGADTAMPVLDFGCGTGLGGLALSKAGFGTIDGTDISKDMLAHAQGKNVYRSLTIGTPGILDVDPGSYPIIVAIGVVSLGAAPPDMLPALVDILPKDGLLAFSYNDPTLADPDYVAALDQIVSDGVAQVQFREHGPHLSAQVTGSDVIVLQRQ